MERLVLTGRNDPRIDTANFKSAIYVTKQRGGGTIWIEGDFILNQSPNFLGDYAFMQPISLCGCPGTPTRITLVDGAQLLWEASYELSGRPQWHPITNVADNTFQWQGTPPFQTTEGGVLVFKSDDVITGMPPHSAGWKHKSLEAHTFLDSEGDRMLTDSQFADPYVTNPMAALMPMVGGVRIANFTLRAGSGSLDRYGLIVSQLQGGQIENIRFGDEELPGPGGIYLKNCVDTILCHAVWSKNHNYEESFGYGTVLGMCTNCRVEECLIRFTRHPMTTGNTWFNGEMNERRGTSLNCILQNNHIIHAARAGGMACLDTHPEGFGIVFRGNLVQILGNDQGLALNCRSRNMLVENNTFRGDGGIAKGGNISADGCIIRNNLLDGFWYGFATTPSLGYIHNNVLFEGNTYHNIGAEGLTINGGRRVRVIGERFISCGGNPRGRYPAHMKVQGGIVEELMIEDCLLSRNDNVNSIYTAHSNVKYVRGNRMLGYGLNSPGFSGPQANSWNTLYRDNITDRF